MMNNKGEKMTLDILVDKLCNDLTEAMRYRWSHADKTYFYAKKGKKFIKIIKDDDTEYGKSVWGFINMNHDKFEMGDVLKAAGWRAPALNKARGNLFDGYPIDPNTMLIYGPRYLR
tara:strand:- start:1101 stop:1448 length:348 start_codon:yes stop_codon:yes gene_type:complete